MGVNWRPASCAAVRLWPAVTRVVPSASVTVPSVGRAPAARTRLPAAVRLSEGAPMPIGVAAAFCATVRVGEEAAGGVVSTCTPVSIALKVDGSASLPAPSRIVVPAGSAAMTPATRSAALSPGRTL